MIEQLDSHLDIRWLAGNHDQTLALTTSGCPVGAGPRGSRFHDFYLTCTHVSDFVDLASAFPNDTSYQVVRDVYLLGLELRSGTMGGWWWGAGAIVAARITGR